MKVGFVLNNIENKASGINRVNFQLYKYFSKNKRVSVKNYNFTKSKEKNLIFFKKIYFHIWYHFFFPFEIKKQNINFLICHNRSPLLISKKIKQILVVHDLVYIKYPKTMKILTYILDKIFLPLSVKKAYKIIVPTKSVRKELMNSHLKILFNKKDLYCLSWAPFFNFSTIDQLKKKKFFLFVGTIEPRKNLRNLLNAYSQLDKKIKNKINLIIVGSYGWGDLNIDREIKKLSLSKYVKHYKNLKDNKLIRLYAQSYFTVLPSYYEGFGLPIVESLAAKNPVICSNITSLREVSANSAIFFNPNNVISIKNSLKKAATDLKLYKKLKKKINLHYKQYNWKIVSEKLIDIIDDQNFACNKEI